MTSVYTALAVYEASFKHLISASETASESRMQSKLCEQQTGVCMQGSHEGLLGGNPSLLSSLGGLQHGERTMELRHQPRGPWPYGTCLVWSWGSSFTRPPNFYSCPMRNAWGSLHPPTADKVVGSFAAQNAAILP